ncbi:hypothetical protein PAXRUDRAFT_87236, partial [Paxillus rubicundulus Ve08.2h10]
ISAHKNWIWSIEYLPEGERVVTCSYDNTVRIWDVGKGEQEGTSMVHKDWVLGLAVTRDGKRILSGEDGRIKAWDVETHKIETEVRTSHTGAVRCIALSPDDQLAASGGEDGNVEIREMKESGGIKHLMRVDAGNRVLSLCFSPNGKKLACAVNNRTTRVFLIRIYDVGSGQPVLGPIEAHTALINCILWSRDGSQLFSASSDHTIRCWDPETGGPVGEPWMGHTGCVYCLALSSSNGTLASASEDGTIRFWDAHSGVQVREPLQHTKSRQHAVAFSPSGEFVASGGLDGKLSIWRVPWWDETQKQVMAMFTYLPTLLLTVFIATDPSSLAR